MVHDTYQMWIIFFGFLLNLIKFSCSISLGGLFASLKRMLELFVLVLDICGAVAFGRGASVVVVFVSF